MGTYKGKLKILSTNYFLKQEFDYIGSSQTFIVPTTGSYKVELWGASGGYYNEITPGGQGAYTSGNIKLKKNEQFYIYVGSTSSVIDTKGGYNGGADGSSVEDGLYRGGGGATDIRTTDGAWNDFNSLKTRIMVAGAGAGSGSYGDTITGGVGGGLVGGQGQIFTGNSDYLHMLAMGGTQIKGGNTINDTGTIANLMGHFGYSLHNPTDYGTGGGSGYFGGGSGMATFCNVSSGAGGSSYISGHNGCVAIREDSTKDNINQRLNSTNQVCTDGTTDIQCSYHYLNYIFAETIMIDGAGYRWTTEKETEVVGMPTHDGNGTMIGNNGNGYAKITFIGQ